MSGKGDKPRPVDSNKFSQAWDRIFGGATEPAKDVESPNEEPWEIRNAKALVQRKLEWEEQQAELRRQKSQ